MTASVYELRIKKENSDSWLDKAVPIKEIIRSINRSAVRRKKVVIRGRVIAVRIHKRTCFVDLQDYTGRIQLLLRRVDSALNDDKLQKGDLACVRGFLTKTETGELSLELKNTKIFSSLRDSDFTSKSNPFLGKITEVLYDPKRLKLLNRIARYNSALRKQMNDAGFLEFQTPILTGTFESGTARPFVTWHNRLEKHVYLRSTMESELRKLQCIGFERVFELGKVFRNEGMDKYHLPEFSLLEAYAAYLDLSSILDLFSNILNGTLEEASKLAEIPNSNLFSHWSILKYPDIESEVVDVVKTDDSDKPEVQKAISVIKKNIIPQIQSPTFLVYLPSNMSPFAKKLENDRNYSLRAWAIAEGRTFCDLYEDETNPETLYENLRWQDENLIRGEHILHRNNQLIILSKIGLPPSSSFGLSLNRLHSIINGLDDVRDTEIPM